MAEVVDYSCVVIPFLPSLSHLAVIRIALSFLSAFEFETLRRVFAELQGGNSTASCKESEEANSSRAKANLLLIPPLLRMRVSEAIEGLHLSSRKWRRSHSHFTELENASCVLLHYRPDGTIDTVKTIQQMVSDTRIDVRRRFEIACLYCLKENVQTLWAEMEAFGKREKFGTSDHFMTRFWVRWLRDGSPVPWTLAAGQYLEPPGVSIPRFSSLFSSLRPKDRQKFLTSLRFALVDDLRSCLYSVTKEEEELIWRANRKRLFLFYLEWPLQGLFLETTEKMKKFMDVGSFIFLLMYILRLKNSRRDFDYCGLFEGFWNGSPRSFREIARICPHLSERIDSCLIEIARKRKARDELCKEIQTKTKDCFQNGEKQRIGKENRRFQFISGTS